MSEQEQESFEAYMRREMADFKEILGEVEQRSKDADERSQDHERTLYGHEDSRRRVSDPGLVQVVGELASAFKDVRAVARAGWAMLGLVGFSTAVSLFALFMPN